MKKQKKKKEVKISKFFTEFKKFITRGNVVDLSVAVIIGAAFNKIVSSLVADVITPLISLVTGKADFTQLSIVLKPATEGVDAVLLRYGVFIQAILDFLIIALTIFIIIKVYSTIVSKMDFNANMIKSVQAKLDKDEELNKIEQKWLTSYSKKHPDKAPKKVEQVKVEEAKKEPTQTELLQEILLELKKSNQKEKGAKGQKGENA